MVVVDTKDGRHFWYGDSINALFLEGGQLAIWTLVAGNAQRLGATQLPDAKELLRYVANTLGTPAFGVPRLSDLQLRDQPFSIVKDVWPVQRRLREMFCDNPHQWPALYGLAAARMIELGKDVIEPGRAATIVLECAAPMSKLDPAAIAA